MMKKLIIIIFALFFISNITQAQFFNKFSLFGGPMIGWQVPQVTDLNAEMQKLGVPEFSKSGFLTLGGGGFIDIPGVNGLRVGGFGTGFSDNKVSSNKLTTGVGYDLYGAKFSFRYAAISIEYARKLSHKIEYTIGGNIGVGTTKLELSEFYPTIPYWTNSGTLLVGVGTSSYTTTTYTFNPQVGLGYNFTKFMYLKLNAGYMFTLRGDWKLNDVLTVTNVPSGIKADGFNFNLGVNFGLFAD